jgi:hypothetical protein
MLDECKGDKFEEVLVAFSTAVLRRESEVLKDAAENSALGIATSSRPSPSEQDALLPLILAHRVSLTALLKERKQLESAYDIHNALLRSTAQDLPDGAKNAPTISDADLNKVERMRREIASSWVGSQAWADAVVKGGAYYSVNPLLEMDSARAWSTVKNGIPADQLATAGATDLIADLDDRLQQQQARLQKWIDFRKAWDAERLDARASRTSRTANLLVFREHQKLSMRNGNQGDRRPLPPQSGEHQSLMADMRSALGNLQGRPIAPTISQPWVESPEVAGAGIGSESPEADVPSNAPLMILQAADDIDSISNPSLQLNDELLSTTNELVDATGTPKSERSQTPSIVIGSDADEESQGPDESFVPPAAENNPELEPLSRTFSLMERTRKSMSLLPAPRPSHSRHSLLGDQRVVAKFPVNPFQTPRKPTPVQRSGAATPQEKLFSQDADYASVFKSRPKIAISPVSTPPVQTPVYDESEDIYGEDGDEVGDFAFEDSPLARMLDRRV